MYLQKRDNRYYSRGDESCYIIHRRYVVLAVLAVFAESINPRVGSRTIHRRVARRNRVMSVKYNYCFTNAINILLSLCQLASYASASVRLMTVPVYTVCLTVMWIRFARQSLHCRIRRSFIQTRPQVDHGRMITP